MPLSLPDYPPVAGQKAKASQVIGWLAAIIAKFQGGLTTLDSSPNAGYTGSQLSTSTGTRITQANLENDAVDSRVLKDDPGPGSPLAAVGSADHIKDRVITGAKLVLATITKAEVQLNTYSHAAQVVVGATGAAISTTVPVATTMPIAIYVTSTDAIVFGLGQIGGFWRIIAHYPGGAGGTIEANELKLVYLQ